MAPPDSLVSDQECVPKGKKKLWLAIAGGGLLALACLGGLETRREYCVLCGKDRWVFSVRVPCYDIYEEDRPERFSDILEPLAHRGSTPHRWVLITRRSLLGRMWERVESRWKRGHYGIDTRRYRASDWLEPAAYWDPELAVAAGKYILTPWPDHPDDEELLELFVLLPFFKVSAPFRKELNEARRMLGLAELSEAQFETMLDKARQPSPL